MAHSLTVWDAVRQSNIPVQEKSNIADWVDRVLESTSQKPPPGGESYLDAAMATLRGGSESLVVGAVLGALNSENMLEVKQVPVDLASGVVASVLSVLKAKSPSPSDWRNVMSTCFGVYAFRKTDALLTLRKSLIAASKETPAVNGEYNGVDDDMASSDPIVKLSRELAVQT